MTCPLIASARRIRLFIVICSPRLTGIREWLPWMVRVDSLVDGKHLFEIGGENKTFAQIKDMSDSYLAIDGIEVGRGCRIPLWLFGFLY